MNLAATGRMTVDDQVWLFFLTPDRTIRSRSPLTGSPKQVILHPSPLSTFVFFLLSHLATAEDMLLVVLIEWMMMFRRESALLLIPYTVSKNSFV